ncbi:hypothetical protein K469DRAFT_724964 [Zopfia rhizophila CBS 207.26]|uniref:Lytic polysaccharide monooxygenase n=1 Tax=Zopfia rhizophila CBS 207.26 TaxID=1314779 RepID=A0A6A6D998_9PEZI|nr:hypothetical protein K469DRAFT_724964 [Zopfia rhizophila CBS 207.26]
MRAKVTTATIIVLTSAHMHLYFPPTLKGDNNPNTRGGADPYLNYPYGCCGQAVTGPYKNYLHLLDTKEGKPVVEWTWQENREGGTHYGGSYQVGFSVDKGKTFKVATTWQGNCPLREGSADPSTQRFDFVIPADIPLGNAVFAWTWVNREREINMNCASVTITRGDGDNRKQHPTSLSSIQATPTQMPTRLYRRYTHDILAERSEPVSFNSRPKLLISIDYSGADCQSLGGNAELKWPNPGPNVIVGDSMYPLNEPRC